MHQWVPPMGDPFGRRCLVNRTSQDIARTPKFCPNILHGSDQKLMVCYQTAGQMAMEKTGILPTPW